ncbi:MAG: hypothetical protein DME16_15390 [Candidatus Rokuibacteriota bacterium]|nr:MAG: hypothetical protein DME16_15390 [Candidatus Rokubacteria bacterium]
MSSTQDWRDSEDGPATSAHDREKKGDPYVLKALLAVAVTVLVTQAAVVATSVYLHRGLAHRALTLHPIADFFFRIILWITTGQDRRQWVAVHRKHHAFTDTEKDPHSPLVHGFWRIQLWNVYYYVREARNPETLVRLRPRPVHQRSRALVGTQELHEQLRHEHPTPRLAHGRGEPAQQPPRLPVEPQVQRPALGVRPVVGGYQDPGHGPPGNARGRQGKAELSRSG